jgi:hypothetical protein
MDDRRPKTPAWLPAPAPPPPELPRLTLLGVLRLHFQAVLVHHAAAAEVTILGARRQVAESRLATLEAEAELQLRVTVAAVPPEQGREILGREMEVERLLLEREQLRKQRLIGGPSQIPAPLALPPAVDWEVSDQQIQALAVKAVTRFAPLPPGEAERAWVLWRRELGLRLPAYAAGEVARRADELRDLARENRDEH